MSHAHSKKTAQKSVWTLRLVAAFVTLSVLASVGFGFQNYRLKSQQQSLLTAIESQKQVLVQLKQQEQVGERMRGAEILQKAQNYRTAWSQVVKDLNSELETPSRINFSSVTLSADNELTVQAVAPNFLSVAAWIDLVGKSEKFAHPFVGSITPIQSGLGGTSYNFNATLDYLISDES